MAKTAALKKVTREDVERMARWLEDDEVAGAWFGRYPSGEPIHLGYLPSEMLKATPAHRHRVFSDPRRHIFSVYTQLDGHNVHIGEAQIVVEEPQLVM